MKIFIVVYHNELFRENIKAFTVEQEAWDFCEAKNRLLFYRFNKSNEMYESNYLYWKKIREFGYDYEELEMK